MAECNARHHERRRCVVIVTFNSASDIASCLGRVRDEEVVVVDNASWDDTLAVAATSRCRISVIRNHENRGFAAAANQGMRAAPEADIVLVNPDVLLSPGALDQLADTAYRSDAGLVAPRLTYPDGASQESARTFPTLYHLLGRRTAVGRTSVGQRWRRGSVPSFATPGVWGIDWAIGAVMYVPRVSLDITGGFDERFFLYGEDVDFCARLWRAGRPVLLDTRATATHNYGRASRRTFDFRQPATRYHWASMLRLAWRYPTQFVLCRPIMKRDHASVRHTNT